MWNNLNKLKRWKIVADITNEHYKIDCDSYKEVWRRYINPIYPMSYDYFLKIIQEPNLAAQIAELEEKNKNK